MIHKTYTMDLGGREFSVEVGKYAELANGAAMIRYGDTAVMVTATASQKPRDGIDFFPLSIDYEERLYSVGKIPGGFIRREGRPTEKAVLTSRLIDRAIRPLFPKDYRNDVVVIATVMSVDQDCSPEVAAMIGASIALSISDIPFQGPTSAVNIGYVDGAAVLNPDMAQRDASQMALTVASTKRKVMMIEAGAQEVPEDIMLDAIMFGHEANVKVVEFIEGIVAEVGLEKHAYTEQSVPQDVYEKVKNYITDIRMENAVVKELKQERDEELRILGEEVVSNFLEDFTDYGDEGEIASIIGDAIYKFEKETVRRMILRDHKRPDGRSLTEIRPLSAEVDILPRTHGSAVFKRGQTQVLTVTTLGPMAEVQRLDGLDLEESKRYMHHYNFPSYSVGEARTSRGPGRREIGHGALAERALVPVLPTEEEFPYVIRLVSDVLSSNGSTSQGSVCGSSLSLMAAGVPIKRHVAGISVGLVTGESDDDFVLMTDIQGVEDFFGDMDFKVAGTHEGITAIQMDIKINGLTRDIIKGALEQTKIARTYILDEIMSKAIAVPRTELSPYAPKITSILVDPEKISEIIGARGKTIKRIIEETNVQIDIEDDGHVYIYGGDMTGIDKAIDIINTIVKDPEPGKVYTGKVTRILNFGAFVEIAPEKEGLVHISKLAHERVNKVEDVVKIGDIVDVKVMDIDQQGRINLSRKDCLPKPPRNDKPAEKQEQ